MRTTSPHPAVRLFGDVTVVVGDTVVVPPAGKPATAFAVLALSAGQVVRTQDLIDAMWGDSPPQSARALVHTHVSALRRALTAGHAAAPLPETVPGGYRLALDPEQVDVLRFLRLSVDDLDDEEIAAALGGSAAPVLSGSETDFGESWRVRVTTQRTLLQQRAWTRRVQTGDAAAVLPDLRAAVRDDPLWEGGVLLLARALDETGRREEALSTIDRYRRRLAQELGLDPSARVTDEHQRLLHGSPSPSPVPARGPVPAGRRRGTVMGLAVACVVVAVALGSWWTSTRREAPAPPTGPAALFVDPRSGEVREAVELPVVPDEIELDAGRLWVRSTTDRAIAYLDVDEPQSVRVVGLPQPPTALTSTAGTATVGLGFSGQLLTIADGRASPPRTLVPGRSGRLTLAGRDGAVWAATIDGQLFGPDLADPAAVPPRISGVPVRMALDTDRAWVLTNDRRQVVAVRLAGGQPVVSTLRGAPVDIAATGGDAWAVTSGDNRLWRATAAQGRVVATRQLPGTPSATAVGSGIVWVAVTNPASLLGYDPTTLEQLVVVDLPRSPADVAATEDLVVVAVR